AGTPPAAAAPSGALIGFTPRTAAAEQRWEARFQRLPDRARMRASLQRLTAEPHVAGTPADHATAEYVAGVFRRAGLRTRIIAYSVLLPYPKEVRITLVAPTRQRLPNYGAPVPGDRYSEMKNAVVGFNAYSPSGNVTAPVVYANYGLEKDYAYLAKHGISVAGKILLVRYGRSYRGIKSALAQQHGAAGCLIYSDPNDDGYHAGDVYPNGPYRPATAIQRGSILNGNYLGAPLAPGQAPDAAERAAWKAGLPRLPTAPLSYAAAEPILRALSGPAAPRGWQGGLPFTYHIGGAPPVMVHMRLRMDFRYRTIWDVIGTIPGAGPQEVLLGNHRDAWTFGAVDPNGGTMVQLEIARILGQLYKQGWRPRRTIRLCSWDAEEFALIGSTDYANQHQAALQADAVAYINSDEGDRGPYFTADAVPSLWALIRSVAKAVPDLATQTTIYQDWLRRAQQRAEEEGNALPSSPYQWNASTSAGHPTGAKAAIPSVPPIGPLGGGSDFEAFLNHVGLATADVSMTGPYGVYHSLYDDFHYFVTEADPTFASGQEQTDLKGLIAMRLADAPLAPLDLPAYAVAIANAITARRAATQAPPGQQLAWQPTLAAAAQLETAADQFTRRSAQALAQRREHPRRLARFNDALAHFDQNFLLARGLPGRPYYKHLIYAPEITRGYAPVVLPGVTQRLQEKQWTEADVQLRYLRQALQRATNALNAVR
ncbi:MAG: transferrin receptor-like dimerization domain-containing protein, partial [Terriglobales bacterium]